MDLTSEEYVYLTNGLLISVLMYAVYLVILHTQKYRTSIHRFLT